MKVLLIEDDQKIVSFISKGLKASGFSVDTAATGSEGLNEALFKPYDTLIVDIMLPELDGISLIRRLREEKINTPVIILSARDRVDDRVKGLEAGADDYLTKPFSFSELLARVQALIRRAGNITDPGILTCRDLVMDTVKRQVKRNGKEIELQPREMALLEYLLRNRGRVVSKSMIMEHVWDYNFDPMTNVVEARICRLREKIEKGFDSRMIHTIRGAGYVMKNCNDA
ncbi:MAG: response regulator transcription factor [Desulfarculaceae bacterium]|nr:response regulator transcription factor [Desulfarculaceae bacterium]